MTDAIPGWAELTALIGAEPTFADAPILDFSLTLQGDAKLVLRTYPLTAEGSYDPARPLIVVITMRGVEEVELDEFAPSAYLDELKIERVGSSWAVSLEPAYGMRGTVKAREVVVSSSLSEHDQ
jgi:hypothetical protein